MQTLHFVMSFQAACYIALLWRLFSIGLARRYRFLSAYLVVEVLGTGGFAWVPITSWTYTVAYLCITPVVWVLSYLVVLELCWLILEDYPGIAGAGRRVVTWTMSLAVLIAAVFAVHGLVAHEGRYLLLRSFDIVHLSVKVGLLFFLLAILYLVFRFRLSLPRNRRIYSIGFAVCWSLSLFADALSPYVATPTAIAVDAGEMLVCSALLVAGVFLLRPEGEAKPVPPPAGSEAARADLHRKLREMNQMLTKVSKRENDNN